jgi:hypothetical protein
MFHVVYHWRNFGEIWYVCYIVGSHPHNHCLQSVITPWWTREFSEPLQILQPFTIRCMYFVDHLI